MKKHLSLLLFVPVLFACKGPQQTGRPLPTTSELVVDGKIWSSLFQQKAAEYQALCLQAFNIARLRVDQSLLKPSARPKAIVTDIDETFLDNSPFAVSQAFKGKDYEADAWNEWTSKGIADTLYGGLSFFNYAASKGIEVFYLTNRDEKERPGTMANLKRFSFPFSDDRHLIMRQSESSKETRRQKIAGGYEIILLLGDNLADFSQVFDKKSTSERSAGVQQLAAEFGSRFIILPNANYGGWEDAIYLNKRDWTPSQKDSLIRNALSR
ncbi:5'-nucleotidase, lipoprotein e(P4) family [Terrimonas sp. NA20]|uniref:5'-nucleotidase, lipoprotein e(P4) family n=1 Tax=Terrimonas ginsenosidimutans TaxID=2908004 RepID=A0ABS9KX23_9BACT|nr:5'-nucleotidase, lipoprotein e(P4) family [Terrimonas ginsenosidimutans]MCG2616919.1 5'-nucleotidase, lipoprotein e(P4) family [Terrimonas ginsenosidimutans]